MKPGRSGRDPGRVCPDDLDTDTGRERPGSPARNGPDAREAGSLTPLSASLPVFLRAARPAKGAGRRDADSGASIGSCGALPTKAMER